MVDRDHADVLVVRQCELLSISRSSVYYRPAAGLRGAGSQGASKIEHTQRKHQQAHDVPIPCEGEHDELDLEDASGVSFVVISIVAFGFMASPVPISSPLVEIDHRCNYHGSQPKHKAHRESYR